MRECQAGTITIDGITDLVASLDGVLVLQPQDGDGSPPISWGDLFFYYAPDGQVPHGQPFASIVTKDYPDEPPSGLDAPGTFRLNLPVGKDVLQQLVEPDGACADTWIAHPVYGSLGWVAVVDPGERTSERAVELLRAAHAAAAARHERRG